MSIQDEAKEADEIATLVNGLAMLFGTPEKFHINKDLAVKRLRRMAGRLRADGGGRKGEHVWRAPK